MHNAAPTPDLADLPQPKQWWRSRTILFNLAMAALAAAEAGLGALQPLLGEHAFAALAFALPVGNAVLRAMTSQALAWGLPSAPRGQEPV